ncbi:outer membrane protein assembly factor BamA [Sphingomonas jejuensis]|nr:outer membrane protein assembly factor BamA [Sphingomonas jejuensis]
MVGTMLSAPVAAQTAPAPRPAGPPTPPALQTGQPASPAVTSPLTQNTIRSIRVEGAQRLEPDTVLSYITLRPGQPYTPESLDEAIRALYATELFSSAAIAGADTGELVVQIQENPVINRIVLEGNRRLKEDKIRPEIRLAPRQIFTPSRVRADVARIVELYRRQGRYAATVEPQMVRLDQNRVDIVFEINEGPRSKVRQINIIGNDVFSDRELRSEMYTRESRWYRFFSSGDTYDPDRLAADQGKLRQFYLTNGYADFRVVSAVAELTPDRRDFIITYVVEEGERYKFGDVRVDSALRDFREGSLDSALPMRTGDWYDAKQVEDTVELLTSTAGLVGYAFAEVNPQFARNRETLTMDITFQIADAPRVYVERIDVNGNTGTQDKVIRREFRLTEGDAFNAIAVRRSADRINSLGFFQENLQIEQSQGSTPDRIVLAANVEERATGELQLSAGFSSLERFIVNGSIAQRNFRGKGQTLRAAVNYSSYTRSIELGFSEPYLFDRNIQVGVDLFRRDLNSFQFGLGNERQTTYQNVSTGFQLRAGAPLTEYATLIGRYGFQVDDVSLDEGRFFLNGQCSPLLAGRYLCEALGNRATSSLSYSLIYDTTNNRLRPTNGNRAVLTQDFAGLGGSVKYVRTRVDLDKYWNFGSGFIFSLGVEGGYIHSLEGRREDADGNELERVRLVDRFFLGQPQIRGFDIRGVGPRIRRFFYDTTTTDPDDFISTERDQIVQDALGGRAYYLGRAELEIPLGSGARELGLRPSIFVDAGAVFGLTRPVLTDIRTPVDIPLLDAAGLRQCSIPASGTTPGSVVPIQPGANCPTGATLLISQQIPAFREVYTGDTPSPRVSVGLGVNWNSPFGPFRIDLAYAVLKEEGDDTQLFNFNVGTAF